MVIINGRTMEELKNLCMKTRNMLIYYLLGRASTQNVEVLNDINESKAQFQCSDSMEQ